MFCDKSDIIEPSDESPLSAGLFNQKTLVRNHLETVAKENEISYTVLRTGPWFDISTLLYFLVFANANHKNSLQPRTRL